MNVIQTEISDVLIIEPKVFEDERGFFMESFNQQRFNEIVGREVNFVQDNHSRSVKGVLRGLHYQREPYAQGKLVRCVVGEVFDVCVDIRPKSETFGQWVGVYLSEKNKRQVWIPEGLAHGFYTCREEAELLYKTSAYYNMHAEVSIQWDDSDLNIQWPISDIPIIFSKKDLFGIRISQLI